MKLFIPFKYQMKDISGEIALVTGAAGGLGRELALSLVNHGAIVVIWDINRKGQLTLMFCYLQNFLFVQNYKQKRNLW